MKRYLRFLPLYTIAAGIGCALLRGWLYQGIDSKGLIPTDHPAKLPLAIITVVSCLLLAIALVWEDNRDFRFRLSFPVQAIGAVAAAAGFVIWFFHASDDYRLFSVISLICAVCFLILAFYRLSAKKPPLLILALISLASLLLCFSQYRIWSAKTEFHSYFFPTLSALFLALYSVQYLIMELPEHSCKKTYFLNQAALLCSLACLNTQLWPYYLAMSVWLVSGLFRTPYGMTLPRAVTDCIRKLEQEGFSAYAVGGCVRDAMLGQIPHDYDLCTSARPEDICRVFANRKLVRDGEKHGTVGVILRGKVYEITTYRTESGYADNRHPDNVTFVDRLEDDLSRRDFTVNAMAYHPDSGYKDPFGGEKDLFAGVLRTVGDPEARFQEDALRILRGVRFACRFHLKPEEATEKAMEKLSPLLKHLAVERVYSEMTQILCVMDEKTLSRFCPVLLQVIPELTDCVGFQQHNPHHKYDVFTHTGKVLSALEPDPALRWAALLHDVGKPRTFTRDEKGIGHFYGHAQVSGDIADEVLHRLKAPAAMREQVVFLITHHMDDIHADKKQLRRKLSKYGSDNLRKLVQFQFADRVGTGKGKAPAEKLCMKTLALLDQLEREEGRLQIRNLAVDGNDLMALGFEPGPLLGECQKYLLEQVLEGTVPNKKEILLQKAEEYLKKGMEESL